MNKMTGKGDTNFSQPHLPIKGSRNPNSDSESNGPRISKSHKKIQVVYPIGGATKVTYPSFPSSSIGVNSHDIAEGVGAECQDGINPISSHPVHGSNIQTHNIDDVEKLFGVSLNTLKDIDDFVQIFNWGALIAEDYPLTKVSPKDSNADDSGMVSPSDLIVQYVDINIKSTSYVGAVGASTKEQLKVSSNFHPLLADLVFNGVNVSIPRKVVEKKWSVSTSLLKEELTRILIWVKLRDVPLQVFEEDGISLIATFIGKPIMLDSYTSFICKDSWGRSSFARCLIEVNSEDDLVDVVTIGIPSLTVDDFTKETICVKYEWRPPRCDECKIFGHVHDHCPKKVVSTPIVTTSNVAPTVEMSNDGFQMVGKKKKRKGKSKSTNGGQFVGHSVKQTVRYEPKASTNAPKKGATIVSNPFKSSSMLKTADSSPKKDNFTTSNSFSALNDEEEDDEEVDNVHDESANLFPNTKPARRSSFTAVVG
uniref:Zinc knuckle CX2CX4HX4C n=1 Tax=Tanacetum cinerariifolium TaxID=118510 RepID=A0A699HDC1_TANCI|nr:zinc knuckle CX2CX4HX4C [Tanacetum cinerariifolium]